MSVLLVEKETGERVFSQFLDDVLVSCDELLFCIARVEDEGIILNRRSISHVWAIAGDTILPIYPLASF